MSDTTTKRKYGYIRLILTTISSLFLFFLFPFYVGITESNGEMSGSYIVFLVIFSFFYVKFLLSLAKALKDNNYFLVLLLIMTTLYILALLSTYPKNDAYVAVTEHGTSYDSFAWRLPWEPLAKKIPRNIGNDKFIIKAKTKSEQTMAVTVVWNAYVKNSEQMFKKLANAFPKNADSKLKLIVEKKLQVAFANYQAERTANESDKDDLQEYLNRTLSQIEWLEEGKIIIANYSMVIS